MRKWEIKLCQKWVSSFHLKAEEIAATRIKFHQHTFHKKEYSTGKICFKLWFPRTKIWKHLLKVWFLWAYINKNIRKYTLCYK